MTKLIFGMCLFFSSNVFALNCIVDSHYNIHVDYRSSGLRYICVGNAVILVDDFRYSENPPEYTVTSISPERRVRISGPRNLEVESSKLIGVLNAIPFRSKDVDSGQEVYLSSRNKVFKFVRLLSTGHAYLMDSSSSTVRVSSAAVEKEYGCKWTACRGFRLNVNSPEYVGEVIVKRIFESNSLVRSIESNLEFFVQNSYLQHLPSVNYSTFLEPRMRNAVYDSFRNYSLLPGKRMIIRSESGTCIAEAESTSGNWEEIVNESYKNINSYPVTIRFKDCDFYFEIR